MGDRKIIYWGELPSAKYRTEAEKKMVCWDSELKNGIHHGVHKHFDEDSGDILSTTYSRNGEMFGSKILYKYLKIILI